MIWSESDRIEWSPTKNDAFEESIINKIRMCAFDEILERWERICYTLFYDCKYNVAVGHIIISNFILIILYIILYAFVYMYVCVYACMRERDREREILNDDAITMRTLKPMDVLP